MRTIATLAGLVIAWSIAIALIGFTSAIQIQKTIVVGLVLSAMLGSAAYLLADKAVRKGDHHH
jgi:hypothetical protein